MKSLMRSAWVASSTFDVGSRNSVAQICLPPSPLLAIATRISGPDQTMYRSFLLKVTKPDFG
jgi:hypothetical protein